MTGVFFLLPDAVDRVEHGILRGDGELHRFAEQRTHVVHGDHVDGVCHHAVHALAVLAEHQQFVLFGVGDGDLFGYRERHGIDVNPTHEAHAPLFGDGGGDLLLSGDVGGYHQVGERLITLAHRAHELLEPV